MKKNYEEEVKKVYPDAKCIGVGIQGRKKDSGILMHMIIGCRLGENYNSTIEKSWEFAYNKINLTH